MTVIWENIKSECFREIIPFLNKSNCLSLRLFILMACQNTSIFTDLSVCSSSSFRKLLKLCNALYYILPLVLVIHVNRVHCTLFFLLSIFKLYREIFQNLNHLRKQIQDMSVIWKEKQWDVYFLFSLTSHLSGQWKIGVFIEKDVIWAFQQYYLQKCFIAVDELRWRILCYL